MTPELTILAWTLVLALVQIGLPSILRTRQYGTDWNVSARDAAMPPPWEVTARLERAERNLFENLPLFAVALLIVHLAHRETLVTLIGAHLFLWARVLYVPLYAFGVKYLRTAMFLVSYAGLVMVLGGVLFAGNIVHAQSRAAAGIETGPAEIDGDYRSELVRSVVRRHLGELRVCRDASLVTHPALDGTVSVHFRLDPRGRVSLASIQANDTGDPDLAPCILTRVSSWAFPAPRDGDTVEITIPFELRAAPIAPIVH